MTTQLSILTAVLDGHHDELRSRIAALPVGDASPFASMPFTHNARFTVVTTEPSPTARFRAGGLPAPMLMCSGTIDNSPQEWLAALSGVLGTSADEIWRHCAGWSAAADKVGYLMAHRVTSMLEFVTWEAPVGRVRDALVTHRRATSLAIRTQRASDEEIVGAFREVTGR